MRCPCCCHCLLRLWWYANVTPTLLQIAMGTFVSYFFSGFILGKIPFPLSPSFRLMLQVRPLSPNPLSGSNNGASACTALSFLALDDA